MEIRIKVSKVKLIQCKNWIYYKTFLPLSNLMLCRSVYWMNKYPTMYFLLILKLSQNINTIIIHCELIDVFVSVANTFYCRKLDIKIKTKLKYSKYYVKEILHALYYTHVVAVSNFFFMAKLFCISRKSILLQLRIPYSFSMWQF